MNYKKEYDGKASAIITDAYIFPNFKPGELPDLKFYTPVAAWDTGAEYTSILLEVIEALHLKPKDYTNVMTFGGNRRAGVYEISIGLPNSKVYNNIEVLGSELGDYSILFGMDIITRTDFLITNKDGKTTFQFRTPSEGGVEL